MGSFGICLFFSGGAVSAGLMDAGVVSVFVGMCEFLFHQLWFQVESGVGL